MTATEVRVETIVAVDLAGALMTAAPELPLAMGECVLLGLGQPFLAHGAWRGFVARATTGAALARAVASLDPRQRLSAGPVGAIGFVGGEDATALAAVLRAGVEWLTSAGAATVRAPLQLSTWYSQRAITARHPVAGGAPFFPLEPVTSPALPVALAAAGFHPASEAVSLQADPKAVVADTRGVVVRMRRAGYSERPFDPTRAAADLAHLHRLTTASFAGTWAFTPITLAEFQHAFAPLVATVDPALVRFLLDSAGEPVGFAFALLAGDLLVVKTLAVAPAMRRQHPGFGLALAGLIHEQALTQGATRAIHALMAANSTSERIARRWGTEIRRYTTYERELVLGLP